MGQVHYVNGQTLCGVFYRTAKTFPDRPAQRFAPERFDHDHNGELTWSQLRERVELIGCGLLEMGLEIRDRVAMASANSPYWTAADLGTMCVGGVTTTIFPTLSLNEIRYIVNDSESRYMYVGDEKILARVLEGFDSMPTLQKVIVLRLNYVSDDPRVMSLGQLIQMGQDSFNKNISLYHHRLRNLNLSDWATIIYTSGTTGEGKGAVLTHYSFCTRLDTIDECYAQGNMRLDENDVCLSVLPLSHVFERACAQLLCMSYGCCMCFAESPSTIVADLARFRPTFFSIVPRILEKVYVTLNNTMSADPKKKKIFDWACKVGREALEYRADDHGRYNLSPSFDPKVMPPVLRLKLAIAEKLVFSKIKALFGGRFRFGFTAGTGVGLELQLFFWAMGLPFLQGYGLTETASSLACSKLDLAKPGTLGQAQFGSWWRLADDGEIQVTGIGLMDHYLNKPEATAEVMVMEGVVRWFKTGDVAEMDEDGFYRMVDRKKAIICTLNGKNIAPAKVEGCYATSQIIEQIFTLGDERPCIAALVVPNFAYFMEQFDAQGIDYDKSVLKYAEINGAPTCVEVGDDFIRQPMLRTMIDAEIKENNKLVEDFEGIKQYEILRTRFTEENGQLTPTAKYKKHVLLKDYAEVIEEMYRRDPAGHGAAKA
ncbi:MAG: long-chain fatty acid--CoA ligase [Syntrophomonadaceae bacterium]|nr:long-chain fatty acid--CoA ligase [Syntrophomonadaceae bacterium]